MRNYYNNKEDRRMKKINLITGFFGTTGYNIHGRKLAGALEESGMEVFVDCEKPQGYERHINDNELKMLTRKYDPEGLTIMISQPPSWRMALAKKPKKFWGFCVFEGDKIPEYWLEYLLDERVDKILVPSQHTKDAIMNTFETSYSVTDIAKGRPPINEGGLSATFELKEKELLSKIHIIPHGYDTNSFYPDKKTKSGSAPFTFTAHKGWSKGEKDRGGVQFILKAFSEEFTKDDNVCLKLKINPSYNDASWNLQKEMEKLNVNREGRARVYTTMDLLEDNALRGFYNEGDCFISLSMAEGFNLPILESMACGVPAIGTYFGGQSDFINDENGWIIDEGEMGIFSDELIYEDIQWFKVDLEEAKKVMRIVFNCSKEYMTMKSEDALESASKLTWLNSAKKIKELM